MYQLIYWLGAFAKTISLLSLIILIPDNPYIKQLLSKGFLLLYVNEILLFLIQSLVNIFTQPQFGQYYPLSQTIMNIYFFVIVGIVVVWLLKYQKQVLSQEMTSMSVVVTVFVWMAVVTVAVGLVAVATKQIDNVRALGELTYALAWMMCLLKFIIQYKLNTQTVTFGLGFIFLFTNIAWSACQLLSKTLQHQTRQKQSAYKFITIVFTILLGILSVILNIVMVNFRKEMLERMRDIQSQNRRIEKQVGVGVTDSFVVDERHQGQFNQTLNTRMQREQNQNTLNETLLEKQRKYSPSVATTKFSTSFAESIENY